MIHDTAVAYGAPRWPSSQNIEDNPRAAISLSQEFVASVTTQDRVEACPHNLYKYPARFAPEFARQAIREFSKEGDTILDCFSGGGTTLIESVALRRKTIGFDISSLACFIAQVKTTPLSVHDERELTLWIAQVRWRPGTDGTGAWESSDTVDGYYRRNMPLQQVALFSQILAEIARLPNLRQQRFARLVLLSVGQAALDCKKTLPDVEAVHEAFCERLITFLGAYRKYTKEVARNLGIPSGSLKETCRVINASSEKAATDGRFPSHWDKAKLVVTSPPYPGVHMLYHRWQLLGRRETPAPFLLANCRDGAGITHYCLGGRHGKGLTTYFERIEKIFTAVRGMLSADATVIQMVAFNRPEWQLPAYLSAMSAAGYDELKADASSEFVVGGRLWRPVPGRKWYAAMRPDIPAAKEVVLIHRPREMAT